MSPRALGLFGQGSRFGENPEPTVGNLYERFLESPDVRELRCLQGPCERLGSRLQRLAAARQACRGGCYGSRHRIPLRPDVLNFGSSQ
jgi:hypothetical protein